MTVWKSFGASVIGPGHVATGQPNQDAWAAFHRIWGDGIVVSDGVGSKPFSHFGSHAACLAVACAVRACHGKTGSRSALSQRIQSNWLSLISPLEPRDCAATCMFAFRSGGAVRFGMLGDGLAALVKTDGSVVSLSDDKTEGFSNVTAALSPRLTENDWRWMAFREEDCGAIILCTDGVADDLKDADAFVRDFAGAHRDLSSVSAARHAREMLEKWPTPGHHDDKTIACLLREEVVDE